MSTPDALLIPDPSVLPEKVREPISGISFATYLFVEAARLDEIPTQSVLVWLGVRESDFERAESTWSERVADEFERDESSFEELYEDLFGKALSFWTRSITPLDTDIQSWICLQRHLLESPDLARQLGLTSGDEMRLERLWRTRLSDPAVAFMAAETWASALSPLPKIIVAPSNFPLRAEAT